MQESRPEFVQENNVVEMAARERSRSPLESLAQVEKRELIETREEQDPHHLHQEQQQHQMEQQQARETEILKERLKGERTSPTGIPLNLPASLTITTKSAKSELDASPASPPTSCPSPSQFPFHGGLPLLPGLAGQGAPDGPVMAAALQQGMSLQQGSEQMPSSAALLQQAQALAQLASLAQLQSMFLLQQPAMQQQQQQQQQSHEVSLSWTEGKKCCEPLLSHYFPLQIHPSLALPLICIPARPFLRFNFFLSQAETCGRVNATMS